VPTRSELAVPLPQNERDAHGLVALGLLSTGLTFAVTSVFVALVGTRLSQRFDQPNLMPWLWCVPVISTVMGA